MTVEVPESEQKNEKMEVFHRWNGKKYMLPPVPDVPEYVLKSPNDTRKKLGMEPVEKFYVWCGSALIFEGNTRETEKYLSYQHELETLYVGVDPDKPNNAVVAWKWMGMEPAEKFYVWCHGVLMFEGNTQETEKYLSGKPELEILWVGTKPDNPNESVVAWKWMGMSAPVTIRVVKGSTTVFRGTRRATEHFLREDKDFDTDWRVFDKDWGGLFEIGNWVRMYQTNSSAIDAKYDWLLQQRSDSSDDDGKIEVYFSDHKRPTFRGRPAKVYIWLKEEMRHWEKPELVYVLAKGRRIPVREWAEGFEEEAETRSDVSEVEIVVTEKKTGNQVNQGIRESIFEWLLNQNNWSLSSLEVTDKPETYSAYDWVLNQRSDSSDDDPVNHPSHYTQYEGLEIIELTEQMNFNRGNAVKYIARAGFKSKETEIQDLEKAVFYTKREIDRLKKKEKRND